MQCSTTICKPTSECNVVKVSTTMRKPTSECNVVIVSASVHAPTNEYKNRVTRSQCHKNAPVLALSWNVLPSRAREHMWYLLSSSLYSLHADPPLFLSHITPHTLSAGLAVSLPPPLLLPGCTNDGSLTKRCATFRIMHAWLYIP